MNSELNSELIPVPLEDEGVAVFYHAPRAINAAEHAHPLAERGWQALAHTTLEGVPDVLLLEKHGKHRLIELFEDYAWVKTKRCLAWNDFVREETERGDRVGWIKAIHEKLNVFGHCITEPHVWVGLNDDYGADWLLGLEF